MPLTPEARGLLDYLAQPNLPRYPAVGPVEARLAHFGGLWMSDFNSAEAVLVGTLVQLMLILLVARAVGHLATRVMQPRAVGEIVGGLLLGPSCFGHFFPDQAATIFSSAAAAPMAVLSQIGLILLMFEIGSEFKFDLLRQHQNRRGVVLVAAASISTPLLVGFAFGWYGQPLLAPNVERLVFSSFIGVSMAITALPILGRILRELELTRSEVGVVAISAAAVNDVVGWILLASLTAFATAELSGGFIAFRIVGLVLFAIALWRIGQPLVDLLLRSNPTQGGVLPASTLAIVICLIFGCGIVTERLGIFTIFGGFACGLLFHRHHDFVRAWQHTVGRFVLVLFLPIFFTNTGLRTNVLGLGSVDDWILCSEIFIVATLAKVVPVYYASRLSGLSPAQSGVMGILMNTRALMELIVLNAGFSLGVLPQKVFTMMVLMAIGTTIMCGPIVRILLSAQGEPVGRVQEG
jgi:Kef-type K+ transport system membrane component KefB